MYLATPHSQRSVPFHRLFDERVLKYALQLPSRMKSAMRFIASHRVAVRNLKQANQMPDDPPHESMSVSSCFLLDCLRVMSRTLSCSHPRTSA
jgi:hypothetical protein